MSNINDLMKKYSGFHAPTAHIFINKKQLSAKDFPVKSIECETSVGLPCNICTIKFDGLYDFQNSEFICEKSFELGAPIELKLGYIVCETVFTGFICSVDYQIIVNEPPQVSLICTDVKAAMMRNRPDGNYGNRSYKQYILDMFSGDKARGYSEICKQPSCSALPELDNNIALAKNIDDYDFLAQTSEYFGLEFFADNDELILRKKPSATSPVLTFAGMTFIAEINAKISTIGYLKSATVNGITPDERDQKKRKITAESKNTADFPSQNSTAKRLLGERKSNVFSPSITNTEKASQFAEAYIRQSRQSLSELKISTVGLPEIKPGIFIKLDKLSPAINSTAYVTDVHHEFGNDGFKTTFTARKE